MRVGLPREVTNNEFRVAITPSGYVKAITQDGLDAAAHRLPELLPGINTRDGHIVSEPVRLAHPQLA